MTQVSLFATLNIVALAMVTVALEDSAVDQGELIFLHSFSRVLMLLVEHTVPRSKDN